MYKYKLFLKVCSKSIHTVIRCAHCFNYLVIRRMMFSKLRNIAVTQTCLTLGLQISGYHLPVSHPQYMQLVQIFLGGTVDILASHLF